MPYNTGLCAVGLMAAVLLVGCNDAKDCRNCNEGGAELCSTSPLLRASVDDGKATLEWEPAVGLRAAVKAWQIRQALQGDSWSVSRSTGPAATAYVVSGLTNDKAYTFQVRAQLDAADFACWSAPVTVVPRRIDDVMQEIEKHQRAIAEHMAALEAVATSTSEIAAQSAGIRDGIGRVAASVHTAGEHLTAATIAVSEQAADIGDEVEKLTVSVDAVGRKVEKGLAEVAEQLGNACKGCGTLPDNCRYLGSVPFEHDCHRIEDGNQDELDCVLDKLSTQEEGLFLTVGYATPVGHAVHNLRLSNLRAACVSRCLDRGLPKGKFAFREIAGGEVSLDRSDLEGLSPRGRRVDVTFCPGYSSEVPDAEDREPVWPDAEECGCPGTDLSADRSRAKCQAAVVGTVGALLREVEDV